MVVVTVCRCRWRAAGGADAVARWVAMPSRRALVGNYFLLERHGEATAPRVYFYCWCECERGAANKQAERDMWLWATEQGEAWKAGEERDMGCFEAYCGQI